MYDILVILILPTNTLVPHMMIYVGFSKQFSNQCNLTVNPNFQPILILVFVLLCVRTTWQTHVLMWLTVSAHPVSSHPANVKFDIVNVHGVGSIVHIQTSI